ncbi:MAG: RluA family pseudouridine synthase [Bacteroidetes bacterium]|nr:RluA family pseudouridine synthase [Bacteroidota bacterium]
MSLEILYEDNHVIVVNKKASDIVQGDKTGDVTLPDLIKAYLKEKYNKPGNVFCGVVHRLDRPTSGAVIFARTSKALERLNKQFRDKETNKVYWAIVEQKPEKNSDRLVHSLRKNENQNKSYVCDKNTNGAKEAILTYHFLKSSDNYHLLEIELETGRHHQIRVQLSTIGCMIKGDLKYGSKRSNQDGSICLHARKISFIHPTSKEQIEITAPVPDNPLWNFFQKKSNNKLR